MRAPLRSSRALVATVEPWETSVSGGTRSSSSPPITARAGSSGVEDVLKTLISPSEIRAKSVNVPPMSTPRMALLISARIYAMQ